MLQTTSLGKAAAWSSHTGKSMHDGQYKACGFFAPAELQLIRSPRKREASAMNPEQVKLRDSGPETASQDRG